MKPSDTVVGTEALIYYHKGKIISEIDSPSNCILSCYSEALWRGDYSAQSYSELLGLRVQDYRFVAQGVSGKMLGAISMISHKNELPPWNTWELFINASSLIKINKAQ